MLLASCLRRYGASAANLQRWRNTISLAACQRESIAPVLQIYSAGAIVWLGGKSNLPATSIDRAQEIYSAGGKSNLPATSSERALQYLYFSGYLGYLPVRGRYSRIAPYFKILNIHLVQCTVLNVLSICSALSVASHYSSKYCSALSLDVAGKLDLQVGLASEQLQRPKLQRDLWQVTTNVQC